MSDAGKPERRRLPAQGRQPAGGAGQQEGAHHHHRQRRDPRLDGAAPRRQAGRDPRLRARHLVPRREDRRLLRPVRRAVRQGARLHADPRQGGAARPTTPSGSTSSKKEMAAKADDPNKVWALPDLVARGEKVYTANCAVCHRPDGKGAGPIKPLDGSPDRARRRQEQADRHRAQRRRRRRDAGRGSSCPTPTSRRSSPTRRTLVQQDRPAGAAGRSASPRASKPHRPSQQGITP